jgi:hypothetical protein
MIYLRPTGFMDKSKSGGLTKYGQIVSASIGADFNGRIYFTNSTSLTQFQLNRLRFYVDPSIDYTSPYNYFSSTQAASFELLANDTLKEEPIDVIPISTLTTSNLTSVSVTTATGGGNITDASADAVLMRGVVWSTTSSPTVALSTKTMDGAGSGTFTSSITGLSPGTLYYVRAYATNSNGTDYGNQVQFSYDMIQSALSTNLTRYNSASANSWVEITSSEYSNLATVIASAAKYGVNDAGMTLTGNNNSWGGINYLISPNVGSANLGAGVIASTIPANNYVFAFQTQYAGSTSNPSGDKVYIGATNTTGFSQIGGVLPATTQASSSMTIKSFVLKGTSSTVGASAVYLGFLNTNARTNYVNGSGTEYWSNETYSGGALVLSANGYYTPMQVLATPIKSW